MEEQRSASPGCRRAVGIGCGALLLVVLVAGLVVVLNREAIRESDWFRSATDSVGEAVGEVGGGLALAASLRGDYPARTVTAHVTSGGGTDAGRTIALRFLNPVFPLPGDEAGREAKAREIALAASRRHADIARYDRIDVVFAWGTEGSFLSVTSESEHAFEVRELLRSASAGASESR